MAATRLAVLRRAFGSSTPPFLYGSQRRWAQVHDVRFLVTHRQSDKVTEKYKDKLDRKVREEGLRNVDELKAVYQEKIRNHRTKAVVPNIVSASPASSPFPAPPPPPKKTNPSTPLPTQPTPQTGPPGKPFNPPGIKTLSSYIDISKTLELPQQEIEYVWRLRHVSDPQSLCAVIPYPIYKRIEATARRHPRFILPLPREKQGAEIHFLQWTFPTSTTSTILFTSLAEFKLRGEYAQPHTTVTHHLDLQDPKGLVLLNGTVVDGKNVTVDEARWLLMCLQRFYSGEGSQERRKLLEQFSQGDNSFKVEELLEEAEKIE